MWVATQDLPRSSAHPIYARLNQILDQNDFDGFIEGLFQRFYAGVASVSSFPPWWKFRFRDSCDLGSERLFETGLEIEKTFGS